MIAPIISSRPAMTLHKPPPANPRSERIPAIISKIALHLMAFPTSNIIANIKARSEPMKTMIAQRVVGLRIVEMLNASKRKPA